LLDELDEKNAGKLWEILPDRYRDKLWEEFVEYVASDTGDLGCALADVIEGDGFRALDSLRKTWGRWINHRITAYTQVIREAWIDRHDCGE